MNGFTLKKENEQTEELQKVNALAWWYTHNMLVHYSVPHGLEQYGGAAWGTRDVCQGPTEYFMATQLMPNESKTVSFKIDEKMLRYHHTDLSFTSDAGEFEVFVGTNSQQVVSHIFTLKK